MMNRKNIKFFIFSLLLCVMACGMDEPTQNTLVRAQRLSDLTVVCGCDIVPVRGLGNKLKEQKNLASLRFAIVNIVQEMERHKQKMIDLYAKPSEKEKDLLLSVQQLDDKVNLPTSIAMGVAACGFIGIVGSLLRCGQLLLSRAILGQNVFSSWRYSMNTGFVSAGLLALAALIPVFFTKTYDEIALKSRCASRMQRDRMYDIDSAFANCEEYSSLFDELRGVLEDCEFDAGLICKKSEGKRLMWLNEKAEKTNPFFALQEVSYSNDLSALFKSSQLWPTTQYLLRRCTSNYRCKGYYKTLSSRGQDDLSTYIQERWELICQNHDPFIVESADKPAVFTVGINMLSDDE